MKHSWHLHILAEHEEGKKVNSRKLGGLRVEVDYRICKTDGFQVSFTVVRNMLKMVESFK